MILFLALLILTLLTQIGGLVLLLAWLISRFVFPKVLHGWRRASVNLLLFVALYTVASIFIVPALAARGGRVPLPCFADSDRPFAAGHPLYCVLNRHYVDARLVSLLTELSRAVDRSYPGTITLFLDANFPFLNGFPLLPHLSHGDGRKLDIAYYYATPDGAYLRGQMRSPIGYWGFEQPGPADKSPCDARSWLTLRWDMAALQDHYPQRPLEPERTRAALRWLVTDGQAHGVERIFIEP